MANSPPTDDPQPAKATPNTSKKTGRAKRTARHHAPEAEKPGTTTDARANALRAAKSADSPLIEKLSYAQSSLADFHKALARVNDDTFVALYRTILADARRIVSIHSEQPGKYLADDVLSLRSFFARHPVPREHPELGSTPGLAGLRAARGAVLADLDMILEIAAAFDLVPTELNVFMRTRLAIGREGREGKLAAIDERLSVVEARLTAVATEGDPNEQQSVQQIGVVNLYVRDMRIELRLAKLQATVDKLIDLEALARAIGAIGKLTEDFIATVIALGQKATTTLRRAATDMRAPVLRAVKGLRAFLGSVKRDSRKASESPTGPFRTLDKAELKDKRVLLRCDLNVPLQDGVLTDLTRIERLAPTILKIADSGGMVILLSHFGRPKGRDPKESLRPVAAAAARVVGRSIAFVDDCIGPKAEAASRAMKPGDILCLENTRFHAGEEKNDPAFAAALARLGDIWVNDAFSVSHRAHASTEGLGHFLPAYAGRAMEAELAAFNQVLDAPQRPLAAIVGGAKISTKLELLGNLIPRVDVLIIGGGMANTFLAAQGKAVGKSLWERELTGTAREILAEAAAKRCEIVLPVDAVAARKFAANAPSRIVSVDEIADDEMILDVGPRTVEQVISVLGRVKTLVWNGPFGAFEMEPFDNGTIEIAEAIAELTAARRLISVAGGGDTVAALNAAGATGRMTYVSAAGGAFLEWLEGKPLPGVQVLRAPIAKLPK